MCFYDFLICFFISFLNNQKTILKIFLLLQVCSLTITLLLYPEELLIFYHKSKFVLIILTNYCEFFLMMFGIIINLIQNKKKGFNGFITSSVMLTNKPQKRRKTKQNNDQSYVGSCPSTTWVRWVKKYRIFKKQMSFGAQMEIWINIKGQADLNKIS